MNIQATGATWQTWRQKSPAKEGGTEMEHQWYNRVQDSLIAGLTMWLKINPLRWSLCYLNFLLHAAQRNPQSARGTTCMYTGLTQWDISLDSWWSSWPATWGWSWCRGKKALLRDGQGLAATWAQCQALPEGRFSQWICRCGSFGLNQPELDFCNIKPRLIYGAKW